MSEYNPNGGGQKLRRLAAILGSPHQNGSTAAIAGLRREAAAASAGWEVKAELWLYEKNIGFCNGCRACVARGTRAEG